MDEYWLYEEIGTLGFVYHAVQKCETYCVKITWNPLTVSGVFLKTTFNLWSSLIKDICNNIQVCYIDSR